MARAYSKITFTPTVLELQQQYGSAEAYAKFLSDEAQGGDEFTPIEADFISRRDSFYQATVSETGWPYVQYKGGPTGFLKVLDNQHVGYADFRGNRQYLSVANLTNNTKVSLILMDYPNRRRLKILGEAKLVTLDDNADLISSLHHPDYRAKPERAIIIRLAGFDWNCPQHIHQRYTADEVQNLVNAHTAEIANLEKENEELKHQIASLLSKGNNS